jgi:hypothetical protein
MAHGGIPCQWQLSFRANRSWADWFRFGPGVLRKLAKWLNLEKTCFGGRNCSYWTQIIGDILLKPRKTNATAENGRKLFCKVTRKLMKAN